MITGNNTAYAYQSLPGFQSPVTCIIWCLQMLDSWYIETCDFLGPGASRSESKNLTATIVSPGSKIGIFPGLTQLGSYSWFGKCFRRMCGQRGG